MGDSIKIGSLAGVPVRLHITFLLIIPVFSYVIGKDITYTVRLLETSTQPAILTFPFWLRAIPRICSAPQSLSVCLRRYSSMKWRIV